MTQRPIRSVFESVTDSVPRGPLGFFGRGNAVGAVNYFVVATINGLIPVDGLDVGFEIESHSIDRGEDKNVHTFLINAANKDVARFAAKFQAPPSNINFITDETNIVSAEQIEERRAFPTWEVVVETEKREQ